MKVKQYMHRSNDVKGLVKYLTEAQNNPEIPPPLALFCYNAGIALHQLAEENKGMRAVTERQLAKKQCELDQLKTRCKEADSRAKPYGMTEWKGGEEARASYIERITGLEKENKDLEKLCTDQTVALEELEKIAAGQDRKLRDQQLKHQAELEKLRAALGMFLFHPTSRDAALEAARKALGVKND